MENKNERNEEIVEMESELAAFIRSTKMRRSPQRPVKDATRVEIPDETSGRADGEKDSESDAAPATQIGTQTIPHSAIIGERGAVEIAETNKMVSNINRVGGLSITLAQAEEEKLIKKCTAVVKHMRSATFLQKNVGKGVKNGLMELEELLDRISYYRRAWKVRQNLQEAETRTSEGDFTHVLSRAEKKKAKRIKRQQHVAPLEKPLSKTKADTKDGVPKQKVGRRRRTRPPALLIKPAAGKTFAEVLSEIRYKIKPEDNGAEVSSIRKTKGGGVLVELGPKTINKVTFCEAVKGLLGKRALEWGMPHTDSRGKRILEMAARTGLVVLNTGSTLTFWRPGCEGSIPDVTFASESLVSLVDGWRVLEDFSASDHQYIAFVWTQTLGVRHPGDLSVHGTSRK
ncbi:unnamed protein product [Hermetia illucens]|uniref:Endonuclease/exonuclease/phosphatase domain-containing protein n=1 Tax=Hermetia illucens TaxID=343691 RepID=A0A7R8UVB3_HERIL|nr:unnamed protein product [Hermetia illucens]